MPMSTEFKTRLYLNLEKIIEKFGTPVYIYDGVGIRKRVEYIKKAFKGIEFRNFFPVNTIPNRIILGMLHELGLGFVCRSDAELELCHSVGIKGENILFSANNPSKETLQNALSIRNCILNIDDVNILNIISTFKKLPKSICFRYNPGFGDEIHYGICKHKILSAFKKVLKIMSQQRENRRDNMKFGIHMMPYSKPDINQVINAMHILQDLIKKISCKTGIKFEFINIGGGINTPLKVGEKSFDFRAMAKEVKRLLYSFEKEIGYMPRIFMTLGSYITKPNGILVTKVINEMDKCGHKKYVGVDARMSPFLNFHNEIALYNMKKRRKHSQESVVIIGAQSESDTFIERNLPRVQKDDLLIIHNVDSEPNFLRLRPKKLLLFPNKVVLIQQEDSIHDILRSQRDSLSSKVFNF